MRPGRRFSPFKEQPRFELKSNISNATQHDILRFISTLERVRTSFRTHFVDSNHCMPRETLRIDGRTHNFSLYTSESSLLEVYI